MGYRTANVREEDGRMYFEIKSEFDLVLSGSIRKECYSEFKVLRAYEEAVKILSEK